MTKPKELSSMAKKKVEVVEAKVRPRKKRKSKGAECPWEVWTRDGSYYYSHTSHCTKKEAEQKVDFLDDDDNPVIVHIVIPPMEY